MLENLELEGQFVCLCASTKKKKKKNLSDFFFPIELFLLGCFFSPPPHLHKLHINERTGLLIRFQCEIINWFSRLSLIDIIVLSSISQSSVPLQCSSFHMDHNLIFLFFTHYISSIVARHSQRYLHF